MRMPLSCCFVLCAAGALVIPLTARAECPGAWSLRGDLSALSSCATYTLLSRPAMAFDRRMGRTIFFGGSISGSCGTSNSFQTYTWDGSTFVRRATTGEPESHGNAAMAYDSARRFTVMFGGSTDSTGFTNDTYEYDGTRWFKRTPTTSPSNRNLHEMAYDSARGVTVLFGGAPAQGGGGGSGNSLRDTWEWDGTNWTQRFPTTSPPARASHAMAYDSRRGVTVLFGGSAGTAVFNDTWEWDGTNWTQRTPAQSPPALSGHAMAFDDVRGVSVLVGGIGPTVPAGSLDRVYPATWEWDGGTWTAFPVSGISPDADSDVKMVFDSARSGGGVMVAFDPTRVVNASDHLAHAYMYELSVPSLSFTQQPVSVSVPLGQGAGFSVEAAQATGSGGPSGVINYQWRKNGVPIDGLTVSGFVFVSTDASYAGAYDCVATLAGTSCSITSNPAVLSLTPACPEDLNTDGMIGTVDLAKLLQRFGQHCP